MTRRDCETTRTVDGSPRRAARRSHARARDGGLDPRRDDDDLGRGRAGRSDGRGFERATEGGRTAEEGPSRPKRCAISTRRTRARRKPPKRRRDRVPRAAPRVAASLGRVAHADAREARALARLRGLRDPSKRVASRAWHRRNRHARVPRRRAEDARGLVHGGRRLRAEPVGVHQRMARERQRGGESETETRHRRRGQRAQRRRRRRRRRRRQRARPSTKRFGTTAEHSYRG